MAIAVVEVFASARQEQLLVSRLHDLSGCGAGLHPARRFLTGARRLVLQWSKRVKNPLQVTNLPHKKRSTRELVCEVLTGLEAPVTAAGRPQSRISGF
jgi:hypothetical protein